MPRSLLRPLGPLFWDCTLRRKFWAASATSLLSILLMHIVLTSDAMLGVRLEVAATTQERRAALGISSRSDHGDAVREDPSIQQQYQQSQRRQRRTDQPRQGPSLLPGGFLFDNSGDDAELADVWFERDQRAPSGRRRRPTG